MCINSWKKYCPDYEIKEWNESNFDVNYNNFTREAYKAKKYAFVSDVARHLVLVKYGGIYFDTDVELIKSPDELLKLTAFAGFLSKANDVSDGCMGCEKGYSLIRDYVATFADREFLRSDGTYSLVPSPNVFSAFLSERGLVRDGSLQTVGDMVIFPMDYFYPKNPITKKTEITNHTYSIHHYAGSWFSDIKEYEKQLHQKYKILPSAAISFIAYTKLRGFRAAVRAAKRRISER